MKDEFVYHAPTPEQVEKYGKIRDACAEFISTFGSATNHPAAFDAVNNAAKNFHDTINSICPDSDDKLIAKSMARLARMWANESITTGELDGGLRAIDCAKEARMWACSSIALAEE